MGEFNDYIMEINEKFVNSFNLYVANRLERHGKDNHEEMPMVFRKTDLSTLGFKFVLVIKNHESDWLDPISNAIKLTMKPFVRAWNIQDKNIKVLNDEMAREIKYVE